MREIHNQRETNLAKLLLIQIPFILVLITGILSLLHLIPYGWLVAGASLFILTLVSVHILRLNFLRINEFVDRWEIRYYSISPFAANYRMIRVDKKKLLRTELLISWSGLRKVLIIEEKIDGERAIYPPISLSLHTRASSGEILICLTP